MFSETGCDAVMIGRAALGNPWIFEQILHYMNTGEKLPPPSPQVRAATALRHARLTIERGLLPEIVAVRELRGQLTKYSLGIPGAARLREQLVKCETLHDIEAILEPIANEKVEAVA